MVVSCPPLIEREKGLQIRHTHRNSPRP
jgi:hypothetical protein